MKFLVLCALVAVARAGVLLPAAISTGSSVQHHSQDTLGNYHFGYSEGHASGGTFRNEIGDSFGNKVGSYGLSVADGRQRIVNYVADAAGFRADIKTNEPGVDASEDPASTTINKAAVVVAAPAVAPLHYAAAPAALHYAAAAPVAAITGGYAYSAHVPGVYSYSASVANPGIAIGAPAIVKL